MDENPLVQYILDEGRQEGFQQALQQGFQQGRLEGLADALRIVLLHLLVRRLGPLGADERRVVAEFTEPEDLTALLGVAVDCTDPQALRHLVFGPH